ncbi:uncharacterized protein K444DRAFT_260391 [Hyaloscypha bicolor E]|uniref:Uncharacterized protein n=1 Tax=Hyaloscypha bicolor E TaxID=1095630 RepID=A0A2J6SHG6_9HELO|nr:uncharacterized protein K444DRAFT_260391 [Hyaloscypha bicolor E]PMD50160.1 hypothetical protein K444DRAFT_260391 [Hyaloscypha bicolor E]
MRENAHGETLVVYECLGDLVSCEERSWAECGSFCSAARGIIRFLLLLCRRMEHKCRLPDERSTMDIGTPSRLSTSLTSIVPEFNLFRVKEKWLVAGPLVGSFGSGWFSTYGIPDWTKRDVPVGGRKNASYASSSQDFGIGGLCLHTKAHNLGPENSHGSCDFDSG